MGSGLTQFICAREERVAHERDIFFGQFLDFIEIPLYRDVCDADELDLTSDQNRQPLICAPWFQVSAKDVMLSLLVPRKLEDCYYLGKFPLRGTTPKWSRFDDSAAKRLPGYIQSLALDDPSGTAPGWVMVYAESFTVASRAADLVKVAWRSGDAAHVSERDLQQRAADLIADPKAGALVVDDPGMDAAFTSAKQKIERTYTTTTVMHFALEPINVPSTARELHGSDADQQLLRVGWIGKVGVVDLHAVA